MDFVKLVAGLDQSPDLHTARLLLLIDGFTRESDNGAIEGLTKLAKLDFLLRYPVMLERALLAKHRSAKHVQLQEHERTSVESAMVRYRFGPWDHRYREFINILIARGLVDVSVVGRTTFITTTQTGTATAALLAEQEEFAPYVNRVRALKSHFDIGATALMRFIYDTFPEVVSLRANSRIPT